MNRLPTKHFPTRFGQFWPAPWFSAVALVLGLAAPLLTGAPAAAPSTNNVGPLDESAFKIISDRNIFNTRRSARYVASAPRTRASRSENFALVGTLSYEKGPFAFFDGSRSDYHKVLKPEDTIAGFKVVAIETSHVKLASPTNEIELRVGMQLRREEEGEWQLSERPESLEPNLNRSSYTRAASPSAPQPTTSTTQQAGSTEGGDPPPDGGFGPDGAPPIGFVDPQTGLTNGPVVIPLPPNANGTAPGGDVLDVLRRRAAAERGEAP